MKLPITERRQIENEMIFRQGNEQVVAQLDKLKQMYIDDGTPVPVNQDDLILQFKCECSDENCEARIPMKLKRYKKLHQNRKTFLIKPKHQVKAIEKVVAAKSKYNIVEKSHILSKFGKILNKTPINNT